MMHLWRCDRRTFADLIAKRKPLSDADVLRTDIIDNISLRSEDLLLAWQNSPTKEFSLPCVAIVAEGSMSNFLAWVLTYFRHIRPFTAHCRVVTPSIVNLLTQPVPLRLLPEVGSAGIGLILAEGITHSFGRTDISKLPFSAFARTLSFAFAESAKRYEQMFAGTGEVLEQIRSGWLSVRKVSNQHPLKLSPSDIRDVWGLVLSAFSEIEPNPSRIASEPLIIEALREIRADGRMPIRTWEDLSGPFQKIKSLTSAMGGPREGRVKAAEMAISELAHGPEETRRRRAFIAGYMVSLIEPGSFDHFSILFPTISEFRESLLWYGVCSGLFRETSVVNYGKGLGLLIKRELERPSHWYDRPNCDVALSEIEILLGNRDDAKLHLQTLVPGTLKVELFPMISTYVKWPVGMEEQVIENNALYPRQMTMFDGETQLRKDVLALLHKIDESAISLNAIRKDVEIKFGVKPPAKGRKQQK